MENITSTCHCHLVSPPLFSNEPSVNVVNHTPSNKQKHFWNPARHEVETLYLVVVQWPMCSPDTDFEVVTKAIQLLLLSLFSSFLRCAANERVSRGCVMNHYEIVKFSIKGVSIHGWAWSAHWESYFIFSCFSFATINAKWPCVSAVNILIEWPAFFAVSYLQSKQNQSWYSTL